MLMDLGTLISRASELAGGRTDFTPSDISFYVNMAHSEVATRTEFQGLDAVAVSSLTSGEDKLNWPTDFLYPKVVQVTLPSGSTSSSAVSAVRTLVQREGEYIDWQNPASGQPTHYVNYSTYLQVYPVPDSAYSVMIRYQAQAPMLSLSTSTSPLEPRWHDAILYKTVELLQAARQNTAGVQVARALYLSYMESTPTDRALRQQDKTGMGLRVLRRWS